MTYDSAVFDEFNAWDLPVPELCAALQGQAEKQIINRGCLYLFRCHVSDDLYHECRG
jgi:hypothetical protein